MYTSRKERAQFIVQSFDDCIGRSILDVGCGQALLRSYVGERTYTGVDLQGAPTVVTDLEEGRLPFATGSFDTVVCTDVLEHVDNLHALFDELVRVGSRYVIVSLPNPYGVFARAILRRVVLRRDRVLGPDAKTGLPLERPVDRHKWFFGYGDAERFLIGRSRLLDCRVVRLFPVYSKRRRALEPVRRLLFGFGSSYRDLASRAIWAVIEKDDRV